MSNLPFQVGEMIELKSFLHGYRGAWFRCKILKIGKKEGVISYQLEYPDYPDQKKSYIKVYQAHKKGSKKELMVRPWFPTFSRKSENLDVDTISEVIVIVDDAWKVGDLVDWFSDGCYWCGKVTEVFGDDKVQIDLLPPPLGEGSTYEAFTKDLRPTLDWSPEKGWTVPMPKEDGCRCPARIIHPANSVYNVNINATTDGAVDVGQPSYISMERREECNSVGNSMDIEDAGNKNGGTCVSSSHTMNASMEEKTAIDSEYNDDYPAKKVRINSSFCLNSMFSNTAESGILDLEELVNRVKWLRRVMKCEIPLSGNKQPSWKFLHHHAPCK